jgi:cell division protein FtsI (penicillin-binding protein 3)
MTPVIRTAPGPTANASQFEGVKHRSLETARNRLLAAGIIFAFVFLVMAGRLVGLTVFDGASSRSLVDAEAGIEKAARGDIVDRNGVLLATSLPAASVYADPQQILDADAAVADLARTLPDLDREALRARLTSPSHFVWVRRGLTPEQHQAVNALGIPGLDFICERRRVYPHGRAVAHVVGLTDIDGHGIAGVEKTFEDPLAEGRQLRLGLDIRVQHILRRELEASRREFSALGAAGLVLDISSGDVVGMVSLPDFDPNDPVTDTDDEARFNRVTKGVYEMGSTMKLFTVAMALDSGSTTLSGGYDASRPLRVSRFTISDYHPKKRWLSTPEVLVYSSNIGSALMALDVGTTLQRQYLHRFGLLEAAGIELPEVGVPLVPNPWREINTMTVGFGHGLAITPLQLANGVSALVNGGVLRPASLRYRAEEVPAPGTPILSSKTSKQMRELMRQVVLHGTGAKADVPGYRIGGKTGTAEKLVRGHYIQNARISSFVGAFPINAPRYVVLVMLDEPKGNRSTANYATGGWVAAPVVARLIRYMAPLLGIPPVPDGELPDEIRKASATPSLRLGRNVSPQRQKSAIVAAKPAGREKHLAAN